MLPKFMDNGSTGIFYHDIVYQYKRVPDVWREGFLEADWRGVLTVILRFAQDLGARRARPFAALRMTGIISTCLYRKFEA
jgi:hypothetical protein